MRKIVLRPLNPPPKLDRYCHLSTEAQVTLAALEAKYDHLLKSFQRKEQSDSANYYKSIYDATFKRENERTLFRQSASRQLKINNYECRGTTKQASLKNSSAQSNYSASKMDHDVFSELLVMDHPPDDEIAESILLFTQKTSAPESPLIDFESNIAEEHEQTATTSSKRTKFAQYLSQLDTDIIGTNSSDAKKICLQSTNFHLNSADVHDHTVNKDTDIEQETSDHINPTSKADVTPIMLESENPLFPLQSDQHKTATSPILDIWNACKNESKPSENPCPSPLLFASHTESSQVLPESTTFDLNVSDSEIDSPCIFLEEIDKEKKVTAPHIPVCTEREAATSEESPFLTKHEIFTPSPQIMETKCIKEKSLNMKQSHSQTANLRPVDSVKSEGKVLNKSSPSPNTHMTNSKLKRKKPAFKPPPRSQSGSISNHAEFGQDVVNFANLTSRDRKNKLEMFRLSTTVVMTLVYEDGSALSSSFSSTTKHDAKIKNLAVLANQMCYLIPGSLATENEIRAKILELIGKPEETKIICNCKEFLIGLWQLLNLTAEHAWPLPCFNVQDPCIATWLLNPEQPPSSFKSMCSTAGIQWQNDDDTWLSCFKSTPLLMKNLERKLVSLNQWSLFTEIEMRLVPILACMEMRAINIDVSVFLKFSDILKCKLSKLEERIHKEVGHSFSINSHMQLRHVLYDELKLDQRLPSKAKIGKTNVAQVKSTSEASLNQLIDVHPLPSLVLEYRQLQKLKSTYVDGMLSCVHDGTLRTHWDQTAAATGRLTSARPNIQAVPKTAITITDYQVSYVIGAKSLPEAKINVREPFISQKGFSLLSADFQQIELRILAHLSEDSSLLSTFWQPNASDVFIALTGKWQGKDVDSVTYADREQTKRIVYSVMYGVGKDKLADYLKVKPDAAKCLRSSFLAQFPAIEKYTKKCQDFAKEFGYTETICARRRYFPHINSSSHILRAQAQRQAVNFCVQGSAADICKLAMLSVEEALKEHNEINCRLLFQIHDELIWEVKEDQVQQARALIQEAMENMKSLCGKFCNLQVPLAVRLSSGSSWANLALLDHLSDLPRKSAAANIECDQ